MTAISRLELLVVHHSASPSRTTTVDQIRGWHLDRGWADIGYHWIVTGDGVIHPGRPLPAAGAHVQGNNDRSLAICLVGNNVSETLEDRWTREQRLALLRFVGAFSMLVPSAKVVGHRDIASGTECPGVDVAAWLDGPR